MGWEMQATLGMQRQAEGVVHGLFVVSVTSWIGQRAPSAQSFKRLGLENWG